jgi:DNA-binding FadR family transcriptional regulator
MSNARSSTQKEILALKVLARDHQKVLDTVKRRDPPTAPNVVIAHMEQVMRDMGGASFWIDR